MTNPLISIAILNYNGLEYLKKTISVITNLNYDNYEVVIVDNGSIDGSVKYLKSLNDRKIRIIENKENYGYSKGKNICVDNCNGQYVLLLDNDIVLNNKNYVKEILEYYKNLKKVAFLSPLMIDGGCKKTKYYGIFFSFYGKILNRKIKLEKIQKYRKQIKIGAFHGGAVFFRKDIWDKLEGYDELQLFGLNDYDLGIRAYLFDYENYLYTKNVLIHIGKKRDEDKKYFAWKFSFFYSGTAIMICKNYNFKNVILIIPIFFFYSLMLNFVLILVKKNVYLFKSWFASWFYFLKNLKSILENRKQIQKNRTVKRDLFLRIKPGKF